MKPIKAPIFVHAGPGVTIELGRRSARRGKLDVDRDHGRSVRGAKVRLAPCPRSATVAGRRVGRNTPFIGGYRIERPMCMRIKVRPDDDAEPIRKRIPFGRGSC